MHFEQRDEGSFRIYAGAIEAPMGQGYIAAVVIKRIEQEANSSQVFYRDECLSGGHRWPSAKSALSFALHAARKVIRNRQRQGSAVCQ